MKIPTPIMFFIVVSLIGLPFLGIYFETQFQKTLQPNDQADATALSTPPIPQQVFNLTPQPVRCTKIANSNMPWDQYACRLYSLSLPHGWMVQNNQNISEFTNYDASKAQGGEYNPLLDKGKIKFGVSIIRTTSDLISYITSTSKNNNMHIISLAPVQVSVYHGIVTAMSAPTDTLPTTITYIQNPLKTEIVEIYSVFGFSPNSSLYTHILSSFQFPAD